MTDKVVKINNERYVAKARDILTGRTVEEGFHLRLLLQ